MTDWHKVNKHFLSKLIPGPPEPAVAVEEACEGDCGEGGAGEDNDHDEVGRGRTGSRRRAAQRQHADLGRGRVEEGSPVLGSRE